MLIMVAQLSAQLEDYKRAIELYEQVAYSAQDNKLLKWGAKDHYFRASLCHLALASRSGVRSLQFEKRKIELKTFCTGL